MLCDYINERAFAITVFFMFFFASTYSIIMAEAIAVIGIISSIAAIAEIATKYSRILYRVSRDAGSAQREIKIHASNTVFLSIAIKETRDLLRIHFSDHTTGGNHAKTHGALKHLESNSEFVTSHIEEVQVRVRSIRSRYEWYTRLKWYLLKPEVRSVSIEMENVKSSLSLLLQIVTLQVALLKESSTESKHEM